MRTIGIHFAAPSSQKWMAVVRWERDAAELVYLDRIGHYLELADVVNTYELVGIDCALGWPRAFTEFVNSYAAKGSGAAHAYPSPIAPQFRYRLTDQIVMHTLPGLRLSSPVSSGAATATLQCAHVIAKKDYPPSAFGGPPDAGNVIEVSPQASLGQWEMPYQGYKASKGRSLLHKMVTTMVKDPLGPQVNLGPWFDTCRTNSHAFEALIAALTARAVALDRAIKPRNSAEVEAAMDEGWIWLPEKKSLSKLCNPPTQRCASGSPG